MPEQTKPCVFCGRVNDFLMACEGVCLRCHDRLQSEHGLYVGPQTAVDGLHARALAAEAALAQIAPWLSAALSEPHCPEFKAAVDKVLALAALAPSQPSAPEKCRHCGKPEDDSRHIRYGNDEDNPRKHYFERKGGE